MGVCFDHTDSFDFDQYFHLIFWLKVNSDTVFEAIVLEYDRWVIPCQLTHFFPGPSPIFMTFSGPVDLSERLTHTKFQLIIIIIDEATALQRFLKFIKIFNFGTQNIL